MKNEKTPEEIAKEILNQHVKECGSFAAGKWFCGVPEKLEDRIANAIRAERAARVVMPSEGDLCNWATRFKCDLGRFPDFAETFVWLRDNTKSCALPSFPDQKDIDAAWVKFWFVRGGHIHGLHKRRQLNALHQTALRLPQEAWDEAIKWMRSQVEGK